MSRNSRKGRSRRPGNELNLTKIQQQLHRQHAEAIAPPRKKHYIDGLAEWEQELLSNMEASHGS